MGIFSTKLKIMSILVVDCYASFQALKCYRFKYKGPAISLKYIRVMCILKFIQLYQHISGRPHDSI